MQPNTSSTYSNKSDAESYGVGSRVLQGQFSEINNVENSAKNSELDDKIVRPGIVLSAYERIKLKHGKTTEEKLKIKIPESGSSASKQRANQQSAEEKINPYLALIQNQVATKQKAIREQFGTRSNEQASNSTPMTLKSDFRSVVMPTP